jgi:hypothetical protein
MSRLVDHAILRVANSALTCPAFHSLSLPSPRSSRSSPPAARPAASSMSTVSGAGPAPLYAATFCTTATASACRPRARRKRGLSCSGKSAKRASQRSSVSAPSAKTR